jgi:hypothetical protein
MYKSSIDRFWRKSRKIQLLELYDCLYNHCKVTGDKGISEMKSKQWSPCSKHMHWPVKSLGNACSTCMHKPVRCMPWPVMSQADEWTYCMGSKVSSLCQIYLYSSYFEPLRHFVYYSKHMHIMTCGCTATKNCHCQSQYYYVINTILATNHFWK